MKFCRIALPCAVALFLALCLYAADKPLSVGMIPDAGATQVSVQEKEPLKTYLAKQLGHEVNLVIPTNYNATVEALGNGSLDFAYLGGLTYVKARRQYGVVPLVQRTSDLAFHSLFITAANSSIRSRIIWPNSLVMKSIWSFPPITTPRWKRWVMVRWILPISAASPT